MVVARPGRVAVGGLYLGEDWPRAGLLLFLTDSKGRRRMNSDARDLASWARSQGWRVEDDASGYTRFYRPDGQYIARYPATPGNPRRRMLDLQVALRREGLQVPPPSKKEQRAQRRREGDR